MLKKWATKLLEFSFQPNRVPRPFCHIRTEMKDPGDEVVSTNQEALFGQLLLLCKKTFDEAWSSRSFHRSTLHLQSKVTAER